MTRGFRSLYGAGPLHLLGHLALFCVAGFAIDQILGGGGAIQWIVWFVAAAVLHDAVLLPLYSTADRVLAITHHTAARDRTAPAWINHVRVPVVVAGVLVLVYFPLIFGLSSATYRRDTGHALAGYTRNWLLITAGVFLASALVYAVRVAWRKRGSGARR